MRKSPVVLPNRFTTVDKKAPQEGGIPIFRNCARCRGDPTHAIFARTGEPVH